MIVKLSCSHPAETQSSGYQLRESFRCPECGTIQRIVAIESEKFFRALTIAPDQARGEHDPDYDR